LARYLKRLLPVNNSDGLKLGGAVQNRFDTFDIGEFISLRVCNDNIRKTIQLANEMAALADKGDGQREDSGCGVLYGIMRDYAYKLKQIAEEERQAHKKKGWWREED
jgi:hypothetical protein